MLFSYIRLLYQVSSIPNSVENHAFAKMSFKRSLSAASDGYPARPFQSIPASPFNDIDDVALTAEDILARPRRAAQFKPGQYTIFAPPSDSDNGYEFYGDSVGL